MNAAAARLKGNMKERFKHNSEQEVNPMPRPAMLSPNPGAAGNLVLKGREGLSPPYLLKASQVAKATIYPAFPLQHLHWSKSGISEEGRAIIRSPLPRGLFFRRDSEVLLSAGSTSIMLASSWHFRIPTLCFVEFIGNLRSQIFCTHKMISKENSQLKPQWVNFR